MHTKTKSPTGPIQIVKLTILAALCALSAPACTAVTGGTDVFEEAQAPLECGNDPSAGRLDLSAVVRNFTGHDGQRTRLQLVRLPGRIVVATADYDPLPAADVFIPLSCAVQAGADHRVHLIVDSGAPEGFQGCPVTDPVMFPIERGAPELACLRGDHQWELEVQGDGTLDYPHQTDFDDLSMPRFAVVEPRDPARFVLQNAENFAGFSVEFHVRRTDPGHVGEVVYLYFREVLDVPAGGGDVVIMRPGVIPAVLPGEAATYEVALWIDTNEDGRYQRPSATGAEGRDYAAALNAISDGEVRAVFDLESGTQSDVRFPYD